MFSVGDKVNVLDHPYLGLTYPLSGIITKEYPHGFDVSNYDDEPDTYIIDPVNNKFNVFFLTKDIELSNS